MCKNVNIEYKAISIKPLNTSKHVRTAKNES